MKAHKQYISQILWLQRKLVHQSTYININPWKAMALSQ